MNNFKFEMEEQLETVSHSLWVEKYRPSKIDDFIGSSVIKENLKIWIETKEIGQLLFYGTPGCGKTSLAKLLIKHIPCDSLIINASDKNSIDDIRNEVQDFAMTMGMNPLKIILLDEFDRVSPEGMCLLRNLSETYSQSTRFILTANYQEKIIDAIKSRFQAFEIKSPSKSEVMGHLVKILNLENIKYELKDVAFIVNSYFPDMRKIINYTQQSSLCGVLKIATENITDQDYKTRLIELLKNYNRKGIFTEIRQLVSDASFSNYDEIYKYLFEHVNDYAGTKQVDIILLLADAVYQSALVFEREITFVAAMLRILNVLNGK